MYFSAELSETFWHVRHFSTKHIVPKCLWSKVS